MCVWKDGQIVVDNAKKLIWPTEEEFCAKAKEVLSPEKLPQIKETYRQTREHYEKGDKDISIITDSEGRVTGWAGPVTHSVRPVFPAEMITDPWTGRPRVFTEEERKKQGIE